MDLSSNNFSGRVPSSVGDLQHLLTLNLSKNHLNGPMPAEFGNIRSIQILCRLNLLTLMIIRASQVSSDESIESAK
ncbi:LRR receptor-like serine/threonine-protein kinase ERL2 [Papaver somniferum]|uniref:LRR receptor-like serine/threonine-protein kinase ERL2 n=1 Tax=Papaver somniferum TaxID=3469 RepID=UPI000E704A08|nr:LRR receptor-like serine/threonine-protein kinase ERL2 [Papaver somniferum]